MMDSLDPDLHTTLMVIGKTLMKPTRCAGCRLSLALGQCRSEPQHQAKLLGPMAVVSGEPATKFKMITFRQMAIWLLYSRTQRRHQVAKSQT